MIATLVQFTLPQALTLDEAREIFLSTAPKYREVPGLLRKHYVLSKDGKTAGGMYFWRSQADAERLYTEAWRQFVQSKYGTPPTVTYFDNPVTVDNTSDEILAGN